MVESVCLFSNLTYPHETASHLLVNREFAECGCLANSLSPLELAS